MKQGTTIRRTAAARNQSGLMRRKQKGVNVIMMTLIIAVAGLFLIQTLPGFLKLEDTKVNGEVQQLGDLRAATAGYGAQRGGNFTGVDTNICANYFFEPTQFTGTGAGTTITNRWKGTITCAPATTVSNNDSLVWTFTGVPTYACKQIARQVVATAITINGTSVRALGTPLDESAAITQCDAANDSATIAYTFTR
ncbi:type 4 pilus major pilin [Cupriavidus pauculus]|uniref:type 4 pilus major pilin n=1 Tax=Cupriavidus pauculus TaxID=82633 RepID=UPI0038572175